MHAETGRVNKLGRDKRVIRTVRTEDKRDGASQYYERRERRKGDRSSNIYTFRKPRKSGSNAMAFGVTTLVVWS